MSDKASAPPAGTGTTSVRRSATNVYKRLLNFDSPFAAMGLENVVPKGEEKMLKSSFYQAATMFILAFGLAGFYSLYFILSPFVKPILWAILVGTVLHPLKLAISYSVRNWLTDIGSSSTVPILAFHLTMSPFTCIKSLLNYIQTTILNVWIPLTATSFFILFLCAIVRYDIPVLSNSTAIFTVFGQVWNYFTLPWPIYLTLVFGYVIAVILLPPALWPQNLLSTLGVIWWILIFFLVCKLAGPLSMLLIPALFLPLAVKLFAVYFKTSSDEKTPKSLQMPSLNSIRRASQFIAALSPRFSNLAASDIEDVLTRSWSCGIAWKKPSKKAGKLSNRSETTTKPANVVIMTVLWGVLLVRLLSHPVLVAFLLPLFLLPPLVRYIMKVDWVIGFSKKALEKLYSGIYNRRDGFAPPPIAKLGRYLIKGDAKIRKLLETCVEACVTGLLICGVVALFAVLVFIAAIQLHRETVYVFTMSNELLNQTLHPEVNRWLESADMNVSSLHELASNAADYGRDFFNSTVDGWVLSLPDGQRNQLKIQLLNAYDLMSNKFFESWNKDFDQTLHSVEKKRIKVDPRLEDVFTMDWLYFARDNIAGIMEIGSSVWAVIKENAGLFFAIFTHVASAFMLYSWALFGYIVSTVVFLTSLYYLLIASGETYKPLHLLISLTPFDDESGGPNLVARAIDSGIRGVFYATFKMIIFYGLYTWFLHSVFEIGIVFLPSLCAAILAAVPIVGAYWASLPGVFQLWLIADRGIAALLFFGLHMLPMYFIDTLIYGDIKGGGHPYLTGLAIVGGVSYLGFEGAILGPVLLCLIVILLNLYRDVLHRRDASAGTTKNENANDSSKYHNDITPAAAVTRRVPPSMSIPDLSGALGDSANDRAETPHFPVSDNNNSNNKTVSSED